MEEKYLWTPRRSVGPLRFGDRVETHLATGFVIEDKFDEDPDEPDYIDENDVLSLVIGEDRQSIDTILTWEKLYYKRKNLIGLTESDLEALLGRKPNEQEESEEPTDEVVELLLSFDDIGLMVWMREGTVHSVAVADGE